MSKIVKCMGMFVLLIMFVVICMITHGRAVRQNENTNALVNAVETALTSTMEQKAYTINDSDEFIADFLETLLASYDSDSEITVKVLRQDKVKGLLSVEVDEKYQHPTGGSGTVSAQRTVIFDQTVPEEEEYHTISFLVDGEVYKTYVLGKGEPLIVPAIPTVEGKLFQGWYCDELQSRVVVAGMTADNDYNFEAELQNN